MPYEVTDLENELSDEAKQLLKQMLPNFNQKLIDIAKTPISILIWGPSPNSISKTAEIRKLLRTKLRQMGNLAMFSEELCDENCGFSTRIQQMIQAEEFDLIISIPDAAGSIAEIHDFVIDNRINNKIIIFVNDKFADGYSTNSLLSMSFVFSAEIVSYSDESTDIIINHSINTVNKIKEYKYILNGRY